MQLYVEEKQHPFVYNQIYNFDGYVVKSAATKLYEIAKLLNYPNPENVLEDVYVEQAPPNEALKQVNRFFKNFAMLLAYNFKPPMMKFVSANAAGLVTALLNFCLYAVKMELGLLIWPLVRA